jgi:hypothetical protein
LNKQFVEILRMTWFIENNILNQHQKESFWRMELHQTYFT